MATAAKYFDTAKLAYARLTTGVTATDGSGSLVDFTWYNTAPSGDWMLVKAIVSSTSATGVGNPADSQIHFFVDDATTPRLLRSIDIGDPAVGTTANPEYRNEVNFGPEFIFPSTMNLAASISVTPTAGNIDIVIFVQAA
jgi:hypothetical protein